MKCVLLLLILGILNCDANICCTPEQGVLEDGENYCVNLNTNVTTPTNFKCIDADQFTSSQFNFSVHDSTLIFESVKGLAPDHVQSDKVIMDIFNFLQGFFLFLILVVFRWRVRRELDNKGWLQCCASCVEHEEKEEEEDVVEDIIVTRSRILARAVN